LRMLRHLKVCQGMRVQKVLSYLKRKNNGEIRIGKPVERVILLKNINSYGNSKKSKGN
jgi:hypothetical protein